MPARIVPSTDRRFATPATNAPRDLLAHVWSLMKKGGDHTVVLRAVDRGVAGGCVLEVPWKLGEMLVAVAREVLKAHGWP